MDLRSLRWSTFGAHVGDDLVQGQGVDVAVIDTGVAPVDGLDAEGKVLHSPDLSSEGAAPEVAYLAPTVTEPTWPGSSLVSARVMKDSQVAGWSARGDVNRNPDLVALGSGSSQSAAITSGLAAANSPTTRT